MQPPMKAEDPSEIALPSPITFRVKPLSGPGSMGPSEVSPDSDAGLDAIVSYLQAHPNERARIECAVNMFKMSSGPNAQRGAYLANMVAKKVVERGIACDRLEAVGVLERDTNAPAEKVRVLLKWKPVDGEAHAKPCD